MAADGQENVLAAGSGPQERASNCITCTCLLQTLLYEPLDSDLQFENTMEPLFLKCFFGFRTISDRWLQIASPVSPQVL